MDIRELGNSMMSCITSLNFGEGGEKLSEIYVACGRTSTQGIVTTFTPGCDQTECFFKQYAPLSKYVASVCIPEEFQTPYYVCMNNTQKQFLQIMEKNYPSATLLFYDNTLGKAFQNDIEMCSSFVIRQKAGG